MEPLERAQQRLRELRESGEVSAPKSKWEKWKAHPTRKNSIEAMCEHCMGGPDDPGYRQEIRECRSGPGSAAECPLWSWRPYK